MKRTPIKRSAMKRRKPPASRESGAFSEETLQLIMRRAADENGHVHCDLCGGLIHGYYQVHHRNPRKAGGTRNPRKATAANGAILHLECHTFLESNRALARLIGFLLYDRMDPEREPIRTWMGWQMWRADGARVTMSSPPLGRETVTLQMVEPGVLSHSGLDTNPQ